MRTDLDELSLVSSKMDQKFSFQYRKGNPLVANVEDLANRFMLICNGFVALFSAEMVDIKESSLLALIRSITMSRLYRSNR